MLLIALAAALGLVIGERIDASGSKPNLTRTALATGGVQGASATLQQLAPPAPKSPNAR